MKKLICIFLRKLVRKLFLKIRVKHLNISLLFSPLSFWTKIFYRWEQKRFECIVVSYILIVSQIHLKIQHGFIWETYILTFIYQVLKFWAVSCIIYIYNHWGEDTLSWFSSFQYLVKQRWFFWILWSSFDILSLFLQLL
jgi:hypothetical protein